MSPISTPTVVTDAWSNCEDHQGDQDPRRFRAPSQSHQSLLSAMPASSSVGTGGSGTKLPCDLLCRDRH